MNNLIGAHCFTAGGIITALHTAKNLNINVIQIFSKNNNQWNALDIDDNTAHNFIETVKSYKISHIFVHSSYLINLASASEELHKKSVTALVNELYRCQKLNIEYLVLHPGSFKIVIITQG